MIHGSTAAAPWTERPRHHDVESLARLRERGAHGSRAFISAEVPPTVSWNDAVSVAAARSHTSDTNTTTKPGWTTRPIRRGANLMRKSPFVPSRRVARGVAPAS